MIRRLSRADSAGQIVKNVEVGGFILTETSYDAGFRSSRHSHECGYFYTVLDGAYTETWGNTTKGYKPLTLAYRPAEFEHAHGCDSDGRCFNICFIGQDRFAEITEKLRAPLEVHDTLLPWLLTRLYREFSNTQDSSDLAMEGLALEILAVTTRPSSDVHLRRPPRWLEESKDLLHERFSESLTVEEVARNVGMNPAYLARTFREHYRCTMGEYVRRLRVESACRQLCTSDVPLAAIALDAGFVDQSHFTKTFKRLIGMTPAQFRAAANR
jgi:AraC family transcriptional regulator